VQNNTLTTIEESRQVIGTMDEAQKHFSESLNRHLEQTCFKQMEKYVGKPQRIIEPNLSKLAEARKQRALLAIQQEKLQQQALLLQQEQAAASEQKHIRTEPSRSGFVNRDLSNDLFEITESAETKYCTIDISHKLNFGNQPISKNAEKPRPSSTAKMVESSSVLVTPVPVQNPVLSDKAAQAVMSRQLTMQLMPMYRIRQRSAGLKSSQSRPSNMDLQQLNLSPVQEGQQPGSRPQTQTNTIRPSKTATNRNSIVNQSQVAQAPDAKQPTASSKTSTAPAIKQSRNKSKRQVAVTKTVKSLSKETSGQGGIRVRKVFMQTKGASASNSVVQSFVNSTSKSAQSKEGGFNLLMRSRENKGRMRGDELSLAPTKPRREATSNKDRSNSIQSPRIL